MVHRSFTDRLAHVLERSGLAMAGAACGLFVAAYMARTQVEALSAAIPMTGLATLQIVHQLMESTEQICIDVAPTMWTRSYAAPTRATFRSSSQPSSIL